MTATIYFANPERASSFAMLVEGDVTEVRGPFPWAVTFRPEEAM